MVTPRKDVQFAHLIRPDGTVVVPGSVAEPILRLIVRGLSQSVSGNGGGGRLNADTIGVLSALNAAAAHEEERSSSGLGTVIADSGIIGSRSDARRLTALEAADLLGCTDRAIRKACTEGRLRAVKFGKTWLIDAQDLDRHRFGTTTRKTT
ncbi:helix-turn-helix domain-containing protein [Paenarthrobacter ureafaciens]|uniref:helix-turn-helix domain-containing protein n=1 Tax=Paenarthrobacter ureafaciens TaxID=37931 RepID=UPI001409CBE3|nr:helix-turn-helix domain-containing protein [Paenarthrobacter ureafaciens]MCX8454673.1 helix-turn-helix domain-containing protein [Paenarthrobacter ureafaciens]MCY0974166.1 helix-turn-helix domain-containing protein [Paenarthrobacter ureafaciens]